MYVIVVHGCIIYCSCAQMFAIIVRTNVCCIKIYCISASVFCSKVRIHCSCVSTQAHAEVVSVCIS